MSRAKPCKIHSDTIKANKISITGIFMAPPKKKKQLPRNDKENIEKAFIVIFVLKLK